MVELIGSNSQEHTPSTTSRLSLDDLFEMAQEFGQLNTGGHHGPAQAEIDCNFQGDDWLHVRSSDLPSLSGNICACINRARALKDFYRREMRV